MGATEGSFRFAAASLVVLLMVVVACLIHAERSQALGTFVPVKPRLSEGTYDPMTMTLPDGRIVIAGGILHFYKGFFYYSRAVDVFDPASGTLSHSGLLRQPRAGTTPILRPDGKVLFVRGSDLHASTPTNELFDPDTGTSIPFKITPDIAGNTSVAPLPDGKVLLFGGGEPRSASILDPETGIRSEIADLPIDVEEAAPLTLPDGRILFFEGGAYETSGRAVIFDPATNSFTLGGQLLFPRIGDSKVVLEDGRVLIAGGESQVWPGNHVRYFRQTEIYDPRTETSTLAGSLPRGRVGAGAVRLSDGRVLVAGGVGRARFGSKNRTGQLISSEIYDPVTEQFEANGDLYRSRDNPTPVALPGGRALLAGGITSEFEGFDVPGTGQLEIFEPDRSIARVERIKVTPKIRTVRRNKWSSFTVRIRNSGEGTARRTKLCTNMHVWFRIDLRCPRVKNLLPGKSRQATLKFRPRPPRYGFGKPWARGKTYRMEITAIGQDVNVYSTVRLRLR